MTFRWPAPRGARPTVREALAGVPESDGASYTAGRQAVLDKVPPGGNWRSLPRDTAREYMGGAWESGGGKTGFARRLAWDRPAPTLTCTPVGKSTEACHPGETRPLTIREYARIQGFPDDWEFAGGTGSQYRQIGNAVPPPLARALGEMLLHA